MPLEPLQTRGQKGVGKKVDYRSMINSSVDLEYRGRRTIPGAKASYQRPSQSFDFSDAMELSEIMSKIDDIDLFRISKRFSTNIDQRIKNLRVSGYILALILAYYGKLVENI
jgi:hypothetical protein